MTDQRTKLEKLLWEKVGPPLYYCADCLRQVSVFPIEGKEPTIIRPCDETCSSQVIAPRKAIAVGEGGMSAKDELITLYRKIAAALTGRCV